MKRYLFVSAIAAMALSSCSSDDFLGDSTGNTQSAASTKAIAFSGGKGNMTRANLEGAAAAQALGNNFIVYGVKNKDDKTTIVYNYYNVNWKGNDEDKTKGEWVYAEENKNRLNTEGADKQTIKYWDYGATSYDFTAFTLGSNDIKVERTESDGSPTYTFTRKYEDLQSCFIADRITVNSKDFGNPVKFTFHSSGTKVGLSIYETIPGYSIKDIKFYDRSSIIDEGETLGKEDIKFQPILNANSACIPVSYSNGTLKITYDNSNKAISKFTEDKTTTQEGSTDVEKVSAITFKKFTLNADKESKETSNESDKYLGRDKENATSTGLKAVSPCEVTGGLTLKVDYTLISTDGSEEEITVKGATATIPEEYTKWEANHIYNYIFKITEDTNGSTGGSEVGLHPIIFDAVVDENANGSTTTETTFDKDGKSTTTVVEGNQDAE